MSASDTINIAARKCIQAMRDEGASEEITSKQLEYELRKILTEVFYAGQNYTRDDGH